jgi:hypothetical protein
LKYHINTRSHLAHSMCLQINFSRNSWLWISKFQWGILYL